MNIEGGISISAPSIGPAISGPSIGPSFAPSLGGFSAPAMEIGPIMGPSFSLVNEGPAPIGSFESFTPLMPSFPELGGTFGPVDALNSAFPIFEPQPSQTWLQPMGNIFNEGPAPVSFLGNTRPLMPADFSYSPKSIEIMENPFSSMDVNPVPVYEQPQNFLMPEIVPMIEVAPRTSVFEPSRVEFGMPKIIELIMPRIGVAQPVVEVEEDEEAEAELERVRNTITGLKNDLQSATENFEAVSIKLKPQLQTQTMKIVLKLVENKKENRNPSKKEKQAIEFSKNKLVKDEKALAQRLKDALKAVRVAFEQAKYKGKETVNGEEVETFIPDEYGNVRSGVLKQDEIDYIPDGSYIFEDVGIKQIEEVSSEQEMQLKVREVVKNNVPVIRVQNEGGESVTPEDVEKVYLFSKSPPIEQTETYQKAA